MKRRVLIIGDGGLVRAIGRALADTAQLQYLHDGTDPAQIRAALEDCDAVVNCVMGGPAVIRRNGVALAVAVAATSRLGLRVVLVSSMTVYGDATGTVREDAAPQGELGGYASARLAAEQAMQAVTAQTVILRLGVEYGLESPVWTQRIATLLRQHRLGDLGAAGDGICNLIHVDDLGLAVSRALDEAVAPGIFNLSMRDAPTWNDYFVRFAIALRAVPVRRLGSRRLKLETRVLAPPLKALEILGRPLGPGVAGFAPAISGSMCHAFAQDLRLDSRKAEEVLGMVWRDTGSELARIAQQLRAGVQVGPR